MEEQKKQTICKTTNKQTNGKGERAWRLVVVVVVCGVCVCVCGWVGGGGGV